MFEYDISFCGNKENCPNKDKCERAKKLPPGIYTFSLFYEEGKECENFIEKELVEDVKS